MEKQAIYFAFEPELSSNKEQQISSFQLYLINDSAYDIAFTIHRYEQDGLKQVFNDKVSDKQAMQLDTIQFADLDKHVQFKLEFKFSNKTSENKAVIIEKTVKIQVKSFFKQFYKTPFINKNAYLIYLVSKAELQNIFHPAIEKPEKFHIDAKSIEENLLTKPQDDTKGSISTAQSVVDLHIEKLISNKAGLNNSEILKIQLGHAQKCLDMAIANNFLKITFVHGFGKGTLKTEISLLLRNNKHVRSFSNNYDKRFGFGATEVLLK